MCYSLDCLKCCLEAANSPQRVGEKPVMFFYGKQVSLSPPVANSPRNAPCVYLKKSAMAGKRYQNLETFPTSTPLIGTDKVQSCRLSSETLCCVLRGRVHMPWPRRHRCGFRRSWDGPRERRAARHGQTPTVSMAAYCWELDKCFVF